MSSSMDHVIENSASIQLANDAARLLLRSQASCKEKGSEPSVGRCHAS